MTQVIAKEYPNYVAKFKRSEKAKETLLNCGFFRRQLSGAKLAEQIKIPKMAAVVIGTSPIKGDGLARGFGHDYCQNDYNRFTKKAKTILFGKLDSETALWLVKKSMNEHTDFQLASPWKQIVLDKLNLKDANAAISNYLAHKSPDEGNRIKRRNDEVGPYTVLQGILKSEPNKIDQWMAVGTADLHSVKIEGIDISRFIYRLNNAVKQFSKAIDAAGFSEAYIQRAEAYYMLASNDKLEKRNRRNYYLMALQDCNKALEINRYRDRDLPNELVGLFRDIEKQEKKEPGTK